MKQPDFSIEFDLDNFPASFCAPTDRSDDDDVGVSLHSKGASKGVGQMMTSHGNTHKGMKTQAQDAHSFTCVWPRSGNILVGDSSAALLSQKNRPPKPEAR